jgi:hypothetical protein
MWSGHSGPLPLSLRLGLSMEALATLERKKIRGQENTEPRKSTLATRAADKKRPPHTTQFAVFHSFCSSPIKSGLPLERRNS